MFGEMSRSCIEVCDSRRCNAASSHVKPKEDLVLVEEVAAMVEEETVEMDPETMRRGAALLLPPKCEALEGANEFQLFQTRRGCLKELCGCEDNSQFQFMVGGEMVGLLEEQSACCTRCCCRSARPWGIRMVAGNDIASPALFVFHRAFGIPIRCINIPCQCCSVQTVTIEDGDGTSIGSVHAAPSCCVPTFTTQHPDGSPEYSIHRATCCANLCINCCSKGCTEGTVPFLIFDSAASQEALGSAAVALDGKSSPMDSCAQIIKHRTDHWTELCTDADTFDVKVPDGSDVSTKARLIAATLLINQSFYE